MRVTTPRGHRISAFLCPSDSSPGLMSYAACHHDVEAPIDTTNQGVFFLNSRVSRDELSDGPAFTILVGEMHGNGPSLGWAVGTMSSLRNAGTAINDDARVVPPGTPGRFPIGLQTGIAEFQTVVESGALPAGYVGGFSSRHRGGANFVFADGSVRFESQKINMSVYRSLANRHDGNLISADDY